MSLYIAYLPDPDGSGRLDQLLEYALADAEKKTEIHWLDGADEFCRAADARIHANFAKVLNKE